MKNAAFWDAAARCNIPEDGIPQELIYVALSISELISGIMKILDRSVSAVCTL
jgi:hypothetical protein